MDLSTTSSPIANINVVPNEILEHIISFVPTRDLFQCRQVNHLWNFAASSVCRHRYVGIHYKKYGSSTWEGDKKAQKRQGYASFHNLTNMPWSFLEIPPVMCLSKAVEFLSVFGLHIWKLQMYETSYVGMVEILQLTPNLRQLIIIEADLFDAVRFENEKKLESPCKLLKLNYLQQGEFETRFFHCSNTEFLEFLLINCSAPLKRIQFSLACGKEARVQKGLSLIQNIPFINLRITLEELTPSFFKSINNANIRSLGIELEYPRTNENLSLYYAPAERFVDKLSPILEILRLHVTIEAERSAGPFKFPIMPNLREFHIDFNLCVDVNPIPEDRGVDYTRVFLSTLTPGQVPVLEKVVVGGNVDCGEEDWIKNMCAFNELYQFGSVKEVHNHFATNNWIRTFPNIRNLSIQVNSNGLRDVLMNYTALEHVILHFHFFKDVNSLLSGFDDPDAIYKRSEEDINEIAALHNLPSLLNFKRLKTLELRSCWGHENTLLRDCGVSLCVLPLQPLEYLEISGHDISPEYVERLKHRHCHVVLEKIRNQYKPQSPSPEDSITKARSDSEFDSDSVSTIGSDSEIDSDSVSTIGSDIEFDSDSSSMITSDSDLDSDSM